MASSRIPTQPRLLDFLINHEVIPEDVVRALGHRARCDAVERLEEMLEQDRVAQEMIPGTYLPLDYWDLLAASDDSRGPRGGRVFSYETGRRTINNTRFAALFGRAFVGWCGVTSEAIAESCACRLRRRSPVTAAVQTNRSLVGAGSE